MQGLLFHKLKELVSMKDDSAPFTPPSVSAVTGIKKLKRGTLKEKLESLRIKLRTSSTEASALINSATRHVF